MYLYEYVVALVRGSVVRWKDDELNASNKAHGSANKPFEDLDEATLYLFWTNPSTMEISDSHWAISFSATSEGAASYKQPARGQTMVLPVDCQCAS